MKTWLAGNNVSQTLAHSDPVSVPLVRPHPVEILTVASRSHQNVQGSVAHAAKQANRPRTLNIHQQENRWKILV